MKKKKHGFAIIMGAAYVLLSLGILVSLSGAKYADERKLYTDFQAADFNVAMGQQQSVTFDLTHLQPGMEGEFAEEYPFYVSNGDVEGNVAESGLKYTVKLRTAKSMPLTYYLTYTVEQEVETEDGETETQEVTYTYKAGNPERIAQDEGDTAEPRYEYSFYLTEPPQEDAAVVQLANGEDEEVEFVLLPENTGIPVENLHTLKIEWPRSEIPTDSLKYMKEVEILELVVTAVSLNRLEDDTYIPTSIPTEALIDTYTPGVLILKDPGNEVNTAKYSYEIDLRAFFTEDKPETPVDPVDTETPVQLPEKIFRFYADNGVGYNQNQSRTHIAYDLSLKIPLEKVETSTAEDPNIKQISFKELDFSYYIDGKPLTFQQYEVYSEKTGEFVGTYKDHETLTQAQFEKDHWVYAVYTGFEDDLVNWQDTKPLAAKNLHTLTIQGEHVDRIQDLAFLYKLELLADAEFTNTIDD